ncbi:MAG TPA: MarR family winged helix-turn-helix transcriptional regulator [Actinomycetes bacterium]|jgi:DNA-binding MarR family transcriptional regulator|nr:MarR family winged helix-turn-helix transcriptional regulator [Actinomycetes bacterium]
MRETLEVGPALVPSGLLRHPTYLLSKLAMIGRRQALEDMAAEDLGAKLPHNRWHHFAVLSCLADFGPVCQRRVGEHLSMDSSDLVAVLDDLERAGWVDRQRDQRDRRRQLVSLTATGKNALQRLDDVFRHAEATILAPLTTAERHQLHDLLLRALSHHNPRIPCDR